jgi:hypothetical protein
VKVRALVKILEERRTIPENRYNRTAIAANNLSIQSVGLHESLSSFLESRLRRSSGKN